MLDQVAAAAEATEGERVWRMPLWPEHVEELKHPECDIKHMGGLCTRLQ